MNIKYNTQKKITSLSHQGIVIEESLKNFEFSTANANNNSKKISLINILSTIEKLSSLFLLVKGSHIYQVLYNNVSIDKVLYVVNTVLNPLNN
ncbi:hypothetical protein A1704_19295 [Chryseobacterium cucumeris]|uniref:hypothetical protein n=1 Tax=Chryseobacterium cucumeris TaxID=1813611 RepID=UPI0007892284|nr:hypothetical protein [Chryseobacterium cucumeris]KYH03918.1 hypothetical protein A1704_19295 [Chryseobacterium cucumeris]